MEAPVQALLRLEKTHESIEAAGVGVLVLVVLFLVFAFSASFGLRDWRAGRLSGHTKVLASLLVLGAVLSGAAVPFAVTVGEGSRADARAALDGGLCQRILGDVASGELRYLERGSVRTVVALCGREAFLVAANAPGSVLTADLDRGLSAR